MAKRLFDFGDDQLPDSKEDTKDAKSKKTQGDPPKWFSGSFKIARLALPIPVFSHYDYKIPKPLEKAVKVGQRLRVPLGSRYLIGVCIAIKDVTLEGGGRQLKEIIEIVDEQPVVTEEVIKLCTWISDYYYSPIGETLSAAIPGGVKKGQKSAKKLVIRINISEEDTDLAIEKLYSSERTKNQGRILKMLKTYDREFTTGDLMQKLGISNSPIQTLKKKGLIRYDKIDIDKPYKARFEDTLPKKHKLNQEQSVAVDEICKRINVKKFSAFLLQGITGSGKTEVYLHAIECALSNDLSTIFLVPEIALTPQTIARVQSKFGKQVSVWHSAMTQGERKTQQKAIITGESRIVIGVRSAIFAPVKDLGLIIVDEEHETTYKQQNNPRYNARDVAVQRAFMNNACVVLGSATPSIESRSNADTNKYKLLKLTKRVGRSQLPKLVLVDMRPECIKQNKYAILSEYLEDQLNQRVSQGEQALLFINRRGAHTYLHCKECGYVIECPSCNVAMTYHRDIKKVICHYCYESEDLISICPQCGNESIHRAGIGIQEVEAEIKRKFPEYRISRMDSDTMTNREAYEKTLNEFRDGEIDILIGTQMIAKGLDFPNITIVGVISADQMISLPDFRAAERAFQILSQVAGRAGRGEKGGLVLIQTFKPDLVTYQLAMQHRYDAFYLKEVNDRRDNVYPPYCRILLLTVESQNEEQGMEFLKELRKKIEGFKLPAKNYILGPTPSVLKRIRNKFRHQILIKSPDAKNVRALTTKLKEIKSPRNIKLIIDVDPFNFL